MGRVLNGERDELGRGMSGKGPVGSERYGETKVERWMSEEGGTK